MPAHILFRSLSHRHQSRLNWKRCKYMRLFCYFHLICCCTKIRFQIPWLVFWSSAWGWKLHFFQYITWTSTALSSENEACSIIIHRLHRAPVSLYTFRPLGTTPEEKSALYFQDCFIDQQFFHNKSSVKMCGFHFAPWP